MQFSDVGFLPVFLDTGDLGAHFPVHNHLWPRGASGHLAHCQLSGYTEKAVPTGAFAPET